MSFPGEGLRTRKCYLGASEKSIDERRAKIGSAAPVDLLTASGSGLDPHISVRNAELQAPRVAKARSLPVEKVLELARLNTDARDLGIFGEPGVNVLKLNLALDNLSDRTSATK